MSAAGPDQAETTRDRAGGYHGPAHRLSRPQLMLAGTVLLLAVGVILYALYGPSGVLRTPASAPAWRPGIAPCRADPLAHVHDPGRLTMVAKCATVSGLVRQVQYKPSDGDWLVEVTVDTPYRRFLKPVNHGLLPVRVIPPDLPAVSLPLLGQHATLYGSWVINKNLHGLVEMHPAWRIIVTPVSGNGAVTGGPPGTHRSPGLLRLAVGMPASVPVGSPVTITLHCSVVLPRTIVNASEVHLFVEIINGAGKGVRWKAGSTNTLGEAEIRLVALDAPGTFTVHIYASKSGRFGNTQTRLAVRRR
jgi:hypothetical protein